MISVIIPTYNGEKNIVKCINSLLNQSKKPDEIIVVDDGSDDSTVEILKKNKKVKLLVQDHKGPAVARNRGAKIAKGGILLFTDDDCVPDKNWVLEMSKSLSKKEIVGVQGKYQTKQNDTIAKFVQLEIEDRYERMKNRRFIDFIGSYSAGYKKDVFIKYDGFDETFPTASGEDPELSFKVSKDGHKMVFNEKAIVYHTHVDSVGKYLKQKFWRAYWRVLLYKKHPGKMKSESYTPQTIKLQIMLLCLFGLSLVALPFIKESLYISLFSILVLFLLVLPLSFKNFGKNKKVGVITPFMSILRTIVFMFGLAIGAVRV